MVDSQTEISVVDFFVVGTPSAMGYAAGTCSCSHCGRIIKNVFVADDGRFYGGDCIATITGDDSTRVAYRHAAKQIERILYSYPVMLLTPRPWGTMVSLTTKSRNRAYVLAIKGAADDRRVAIAKALARNNGLKIEVG